MAVTKQKIYEELKDRLSDVFRHYGVRGVQEGSDGQCSAFCPFHDEQKPSFSFNIRTGMWTCHKEQIDGDIFDFVARASNLDSKSQFPKVMTTMAQVFAPYLLGADSAKKTAEVVNLWQRSISINHPDAQIGRDYLLKRGIASLLEWHDLDSVCRFHLDVYDGETKQRFPALLFSIVGAGSSIIGLQRIFLGAEGQKAEIPRPKKVLGSMRGGAIKFGEPSAKLHIAEGPETAASIHDALQEPVWSLVSVSTFKSFVLLKSISELHIWADKDRSGVGEKAAFELARRLAGKSVQVFVHIPPSEIEDGKKSLDWLDIYNAFGPKALRDSVGQRVFGKNQIQIWDGRDYLKEANFPTPVPIVESLICEREFVILSATAKTGKSLLGLQLALSVATGRPFLEKFGTVRSRVVIVQTEISDGRYSERLRQMTKQLNIDLQANEVGITSHRLKIDDSESFAALRNVIREDKFKLVILDPFYTLHSKDEDKAKDIAPLLADLRQMIIEEGATCFLIHHQGKYGERSDKKQTGHQHRGSSAFADVPDSSWSLSLVSSEGEPQASLSFELRNFEPVESLRLGRKSGELIWSILGSDKLLSMRQEGDLIAQAIRENEGIAKDKLAEILLKKYKKGFSPRSCDKKIADAERAGLIATERVGNEVRHYTSEHFHNVILPARNPLNEMPIADESPWPGMDAPQHEGNLQ